MVISLSGRIAIFFFFLLIFSKISKFPAMHMYQLMVLNKSYSDNTSSAKLSVSSRCQLLYVTFLFCPILSYRIFHILLYIFITHLSPFKIFMEVNHDLFILISSVPSMENEKQELKKNYQIQLLNVSHWELGNGGIIFSPFQFQWCVHM